MQITDLGQFENMRAIGVSPDIEERYLGTMTVLGCPMHVELVAVHEDEEGTQVPDAEYLLDELDALATIDCDGGWSTVTFNGREYVFLAYPYSR
jgi:hypothetical protein